MVAQHPSLDPYGGQKCVQASFPKTNSWGAPPTFRWHPQPSPLLGTDMETQDADVSLRPACHLPSLEPPGDADWMPLQEKEG